MISQETVRKLNTTRHKAIKWRRYGIISTISVCTSDKSSKRSSLCAIVIEQFFHVFVNYVKLVIE